MVVTVERARPVAPPLVGVVAAGAGLACFVHFGFSARALVAAVFSAALVVLSAMDIEQRVIPAKVALGLGYVILLGDIAAAPARAREWILAAAATLAGGLLLTLATRGGIARSDALVGLALGAGLGWNILGALVVSALGLFVAAVVVLVRGGPAARKATLPAIPFLALGAIVVILLS
jgi:prepilin signal peptidase PulO-like enzyme (type II secretory pathway)